jgi:glycosyltransferase involved in cell wall biosynthesis
MKPTLAIISTYEVQCGIASYTARLVELLKADFDITVLPIDTSIVKRGDSEARALFTDLANKGKHYDFVNIQFEYSLYGATPYASWSNLRTLLTAFARPSITLHTIVAPHHLEIHRLAIEIVKLRIWTAVRRMLAHWKSRKLLDAYRVIAAAQDKKPVPVFVHTNADREYLTKTWSIKDVHAHPLCYVTSQQRHKILAESSRASFPRLRSLDPGVCLIGAFGFLNDYKGFDLAILALRRLPDNYHLAIFGGLHPNASVPNCATPPYVTILQQYAQGRGGDIWPAKDVSSRVHFMGQVDDDAFLHAIAVCDIVVFPYFEVGQSSSGPLSMAVDLRKKVLASRTKCFQAFAEFNTAQVSFFDVGNVLEMAQALEELADRKIEPAAPRYTAETNREHYLRAITHLGQTASPQCTTIVDATRTP